MVTVIIERYTAFPVVRRIDVQPTVEDVNRRVSHIVIGD
jgi:hypothetical protein